jgi:hypothetical protein
MFKNSSPESNITNFPENKSWFRFTSVIKRGIKSIGEVRQDLIEARRTDLEIDQWANDNPVRKLAVASLAVALKSLSAPYFLTRR